MDRIDDLDIPGSVDITMDAENPKMNLPDHGLLKPFRDGGRGQSVR